MKPLMSVPLVFDDTPETRQWLRALIDGGFVEMSKAEDEFRQKMTNVHYDLLREIRRLARERDDL